MKKLLIFIGIFSFCFMTPEVVEAQFFQKVFGKKSPQRKKTNKRRKGSSRVGSFSGTKKIVNKEISYFTVGGGINSINYFGDLAPNPRTLSTDVSFTRPGINLTYGQKFGERYHWRGNFMMGRISGSDFESAGLEQVNANRHLRNHTFRNDIQEISGLLIVDLFKHSGNYQSRPPLIPYVFVGVSIFHHNPKAQVPEFFYLNENPNSAVRLEQAGQWVSLWDIGMGGQRMPSEARERYKEVYGRDLPNNYNRVQIAIPVGLGIKYKVNRNLDIAFELGYRHTFTNFLDDLGGALYMDPSAFLMQYPGDLDKAYTAMALADRSMELYHQYEGEQAGSFQNVRDRIYNQNIRNIRLEFDEEGILNGYRRFAGYGEDSYLENREDVWNRRGGANSRDYFFVTNIRVSYILGKSQTRNAKFR